jgi:hypothetical protein
VSKPNRFIDTDPKFIVVTPAPPGNDVDFDDMDEEEALDIEPDDADDDGEDD